ncbi:MAG: hypothetical protein EZS28_013995 [Streblomastix strix]|uniref:Uncharacterized protein n=1 Tax=Streblomastix strix TaxID=222440 RepID=A0A5J4W6A3_9EUKA|nr:MAG: hypothetical protein EZS28_013995 [Streblomastix strix]
MGFFSRIANFGSKILGGIKNVTKWVAPALHKVLSTILGSVGMTHPGIGGALEIQNLPKSAKEDFSFDTESGAVWIYDQNWYNSGDIVPDQVTPASDATPLSDGTAAAGTNTEYTRGDHVHPLNITTIFPPSDSASGTVGTTNYYARNDHSHPINVETNVSNIPAVNGVGVNGTSVFYARQDQVHLQQLTYDGNITATKFIKSR